MVTVVAVVRCPYWAATACVAVFIIEAFLLVM
jgi:hypothetical protein